MKVLRELWNGPYNLLSPGAGNDHFKIVDRTGPATAVARGPARRPASTRPAGKIRILILIIDLTLGVITQYGICTCKLPEAWCMNGVPSPEI
jgi:hypothetical protein